MDIDLNFDADGSGLGEIPSQQAAKTSKLRRSCESCRRYKARCNPSESNPDRCQRCIRDDKKCIFLAAKARPKRAINSKARVIEMEQKLDDLMALLQSRGPVGQQDTPTPAASPPPMPQTPDLTVLLDDITTSGVLPGMSSQRQDILSTPHQFSVFRLPGIAGDKIGDVISKGIISYDMAEEYLQLWRTKTVYFPFVVLPLRSTLDTLRRDKPCLLLSIFCFSAAILKAKPVRTLEQEFRESLSRKVIVNGEKSLDLLQSLLLYIAWYHFYFDPHRQQIYQFSQMAIAMAVDLCIHKPALPPASPTFTPLDLLTSPDCEHKALTDDMEAKRTLLGCYVLTASVCQSLRKPINMKYTDYLGQCCTAFAQNPETETDLLLQYYVRLQHFQEEVNSAFDYDSFHNLRALDSGRIEILLRSFNRQLAQFEDSFPPEIWTNVQIVTTFYCLRIYLHEIGFHASPPPLSAQGTYSQSHMQNWYYSNARTESLLACLQASKNYLDRCLMLPSGAMAAFNLPDLSRIIYALLVLGSFTRLHEFPRIQERANFVHYLNAFHAKTTEILKMGNGPECFIYLDRLFQASGIWLTNIVADPSSTTPMGKCSNYHPNFLAEEVSQKAVVRTIWFQGMFGRVEEACKEQMQQQQQEQWEELDMLSNWPVAGGGLDEVLFAG